MKIGIQTWGSEGDVRPFIALAAGLHAAGHEVSLAATHLENKDFSALSKTLGFPIEQVGLLDPSSIRRVGEILARETNVLKQLDLTLTHLFYPVTADMLAASKRLCRESDVVIGHFLVHPLRAAAEQSGRPCISVFTGPMTPTSSFSPLGGLNFGALLNSMLWKISDLVISRKLLPGVNAMRRAENLAPVRSAMRDLFLSPVLNLIEASPSLCPTPSDWDERIRICGVFTLPDQGSAWQMPDPLRAFFDAGSPPVYMTLGSMSLGDPSFSRTARLLAEAALEAGCRAIIQTSGNSHDGAPESPDVLYLSHAPHDQVFPRCAAIVHHGGAGTTHSATRAGCPSIVVEHLLDQTFWGNALKRAGVALPMLHARTVTAKKLSRTIRQVLESPSMRERARHVGTLMLKEDGVGQAVKLIEEACAKVK